MFVCRGGGARVSACPCTCVEVRGQLTGVSFLFLPVGPMRVGMFFQAEPFQQPTVQTPNPGDDGLTLENYKS